MADDQTSLSQSDVADYVGVMATELSQMCEAAQLDALATILYAAHLEARRVRARLDRASSHDSAA